MYGDFYKRVLQELVADRHIDLTDSVHAVCGGSCDVRVLHEMGFCNVSLSNLGTFVYDQNDGYRGFKFFVEDAEALSFKDASIDWVIVHAGLHHCASPHRALLEMRRVARKGVLVLEARDSWLVRLGVTLHFTADFESDQPITDGRGGVNNTAIPNFVYRWTEREVYKVIESAYPHLDNKVRFFYGLDLPERLGKARAALSLLAKAVRIIAPRQCNNFAFALFCTEELKPWLARSGGEIRVREGHYDFNL